MSRQQIIILSLVLFFAFVAHLAFVAAPGYQRDIQLFKTWSQTAAVHGVYKLYDQTWCDYPPAYLYVLKVTGLFYRIFYPRFDEQTYLFNLLIKFPAILADLLISLIVFLFLRKSYSYKISLLAMSAYAFNPVIILNSAYWGQVDAVPILVSLLAILALIKEKYPWSWGLITLGILIKTQLVALLPVVILVTWQKRGFKKVLSGIAVSWLSFILVLLPFFYYHKIDQVINRILDAVGEYPYLSMNAYNFWWLFSFGRGREILDSGFFLNLLTYRALGIVLLVCFALLVLYYLFKKAKERESLFLSAALLPFGFFMLPTEMHERYILPMLVFLLLAAIKNRGLKIVYAIVSLTAFLNLLMVLMRAYPQNFTFHLAFPLDLVVSLVNLSVLIYFILWLVKAVKLRLKYSQVFFALAVIVLSGFGWRIYHLNRPLYLSDLAPAEVSQEWGSLKHDRTVDGKRLTVNGYIYAKGLGTHANSTIVYQLNRRYKFLEGSVGIDDEASHNNKRLEFLIYADNKLIYRSGILSGRRDPKYFYLPIDGIKKIRLIVNDGADGINSDHADWLDLKVLP